jgi:hypothetical protein
VWQPSNTPDYSKRSRRAITVLEFTCDTLLRCSCGGIGEGGGAVRSTQKSAIVHSACGVHSEEHRL